MLVTWTVQKQGQCMLVVKWLLAKKVKYVGHMDSTKTGSMNAGS
jgi:hypothetical protein